MNAHATLPAMRGEQALSRQTFKVLGQGHPFQDAWREALVPVGASILDCLEQVGLEPTSSTQVWLNGRWIAMDDWRRVRPKANTLIRARPFPRGGMARSILLIAVAVIATAAAVFTGFAATPAAGPAWGAAIGSMAGLSVSRGGCVQVCGIVPRRRAG